MLETRVECGLSFSIVAAAVRSTVTTTTAIVAAAAVAVALVVAIAGSTTSGMRIVAGAVVDLSAARLVVAVSMAVCDDATIARMLAATLADRSKAFERLSLAWLVKALHSWKMPLWVMCAFLCIVYGRGVRAIIRGKLGFLRLIQCGLGMGGPASAFLWKFAYDALVTGLAGPRP